MNNKDIISFRMEKQGLSKPVFESVVEVVKWMGCIQAQEFPNAKWAIGMRIPGCTEEMVDDAFNTGKILRTHVLRPTWHFILPEDIRWMVELTGPRVKLLSKHMHRKLDIDNAVLRKSKKILIKALEGKNFLNRVELKQHFQKAGLNTDDIRVTMLLMDAELDGLICSGPRRGKQFTYALLEEVVSKGLDIKDDAAIAALARRYFTSRGPATIYDFAWWSGLTLTQAKRGVEMIKKDMEHTVINEQEYWFINTGIHKEAIPQVRLLPSYDEYVVSYTDRSTILSPGYEQQTFNGLKQSVLINGKIKGTWKRTLEKGNVKIEITPFENLTQAIIRELNKEVKRYMAFIGADYKPELIIQRPFHK